MHAIPLPCLKCSHKVPPTALISLGSADAFNVGSLCCFQPLDCVYWLMYELSSKGTFAFYHTFSPTTKEEGIQEAQPFMDRKCLWIKCVCSGATKQTVWVCRRDHSSQKSSWDVTLWASWVKDVCVGGGVGWGRTAEEALVLRAHCLCGVQGFSGSAQPHTSSVTWETIVGPLWDAFYCWSTSLMASHCGF